MEGNLRSKVAGSFFWVFIDSSVQRVLQFIIGIILARILLPEEFGLLGMIVVFIKFSELFIDSGFSFALIRKEKVARIEYETVFWFNTCISILFFILLWFSSPFIADFFNKPILTGIVRAVSFGLLINATGSIQNIRLRRDLKFKELAITGISSKLISGITAIFLAINGFGVWALVFQQLLNNFLRVGFMFFFNRLLPRLKFSLRSFKELFSFSSKLLYGGIVSSVVSNIYPIIIGKFFSASDVGFFDKAKTIQGAPVQFFTGIVQQVTLPTFAKIQNENDRFRNAYRNVIKISFFAIILPLALIVISAKPLIVVLLTDKWLPAAEILQIIALGGMFYPLSALNVNIIGLKGRSDLVMYLQFSKDALTILGVLVGIWFGIRGLVISYTITCIFAYLLNALFSNKVIDYPFYDQLYDILPFVLLALVTMLLAGLAGFLVDNLLIKLIIIWSTGLIVYFLLAYILNFKVLDELKKILFELLSRIK